jgi:hypothetical protein
MHVRVPLSLLAVPFDLHFVLETPMAILCLALSFVSAVLFDPLLASFTFLPVPNSYSSC